MVGEQTGSVRVDSSPPQTPPPVQYAKQNSWQKMTALGSTYCPPEMDRGILQLLLHAVGKVRSPDQQTDRG